MAEYLGQLSLTIFRCSVLELWTGRVQLGLAIRDRSDGLGAGGVDRRRSIAAISTSPRRLQTGAPPTIEHIQVDTSSDDDDDDEDGDDDYQTLTLTLTISLILTLTFT